MYVIKNKPSNITDNMIMNQNIYQILPLEYLDAILVNKKLRFNNIFKSWDDPYELFLFRNMFKKDNWLNGEINRIQNCFYGQCWSFLRNSDALWQIYSKDKRSVRIRTKLQTLVDIVAQNALGEYIPSYGWVKYETQKAINEKRKQFLNNSNNWFPDSAAVKDSLFVKRSAFAYEKEFRVILQTTLSVKNRSYIEISVDPEFFIDQIAFDPRMDFKLFRCKKKIYEKWFPSKKIVRSDLYTNPK